jgi:hypothetical protein
MVFGVHGEALFDMDMLGVSPRTPFKDGGERLDKE